jgi:glycosyltransferase involved in cell wall biosynthesis
MKVLLVAGVGERPEAHLFPELARRGIDVDLLCDDASPYFHPLKASGFPMTPLKMRARIDLRAIRTIRAFLRGNRYDIVHAFNGRALSNSLMASMGIPIKRIGYCGTMGHLKRWDPSAYLAVLNPRVDRIVCLSQAVERYLRSLGIPGTRLTQIYKGHDPAWFQALPRGALNAFGIPDGAVVVGCVANVRPIKGVPILIEALSRLASAYPVHLLLLGQNRDDEVGGLVRHSPARERIHVAGFRMDAPNLIGACDLFVMPTVRNEGLSKAVIEAMCVGVPCIVTGVGGMPELIVDGQTGRIVPPGDPQALADAIGGYAGAPDIRAEHGRNGLRRVQERFAFTRMVDEYVRLYTSLVNPM